MATTFPGMAGFLDGGATTGTARPANDPDAFPETTPALPVTPLAGASHPDEPRPLFGEPERPTRPSDGYEPKDVQFLDDPVSVSTKVRPVPNDTFSPKPLFGDEPASPAPKQAAPAAPGALRFNDAPPAPRAPVAPVRSGSGTSASAPLSFPNAPAKPSAPGQHSLFESTESPLVRRSIEVAQQRYPELWATDDGATFKRQLRQLLPLDRATIDAWGTAVLDRVSDMASTTATVTRTFLALHANETLNQALQDARAPAPSMWQRMVKGGVSLDECRLRLSNLRQAMAPLLEQVDRDEKDAREAAKRLARDLASLSVITTVSGTISNNGLARSLDDRSSLLASSLRQAEVLPGQLKNLGDQMRTLNRQVDEALSVTFPALALARAARG